MIFPTGPVRVMVATKPVDFRKGMDGLAALVKEELATDPPIWRGCSVIKWSLRHTRTLFHRKQRQVMPLPRHQDPGETIASLRRVHKCWFYPLVNEHR